MKSHVLLVSLLLAPPLLAQPATQQADAALKAAYDAWHVHWRAYTDAMGAARRAGQLPKGGEPPAEIRALKSTADTARDALLARFGKRNDLSSTSYKLLARIHELARDYRAAVTDYERSLAAGDSRNPDITTLHSMCIAAMNSKDNELAARWMKRTIEHENGLATGRRNLSVRTSYYPRTLIALGDWQGLAAHLEVLARDDARCRVAATTFGIVLAIHNGDEKAAQAGVDAIRADPEKFPDHQAWAVLVELALCSSRGAFDQGAKLVAEFLANPDDGGDSAVDRNRRRYLRAIAPFLGKPAPDIHVDEWVGGTVMGDDVLKSLRGTVVVLDFWQPWCEPCRKAMPKLVALQKEHPEQLTVLGLCKVESYGYDVSERRAVRPIAPEDYVEHVVDFDLDMNLNYLLAISRTDVNNRAYGVAGIPTLVVIDRRGIVRYMSCGAGEPGLLELAVRGVLRAE
jgi:thiol-disulfide isomerase/thioredoxin